ncbi:hypothetical protein [Vermiculatibacterium agrestimuris]|uniref:hypothetical protein n=1 Tax=Vermiculatibacterium agrestimuris TaxID=2941519 RepID=UPI00203E6007|nr:hypothetical protein [Vermiculatibacterium agrestimuris]
MITLALEDYLDLFIKVVDVTLIIWLGVFVLEKLLPLWHRLIERLRKCSPGRLKLLCWLAAISVLLYGLVCWLHPEVSLPLWTVKALFVLLTAVSTVTFGISAAAWRARRGKK